MRKIIVRQFVGFHRFWHWPFGKKIYFIQLIVIIPIIDISICTLGLRRTTNLLNKWPYRDKCPTVTEAHTILQDAVAVFSIALHYIPFKGKCLSQSLSLWWILKHAGIETDVKIGTIKTRKKFKAHAWLERDGVPLIDSHEVLQNFHAFKRNFQSIK